MKSVAIGRIVHLSFEAYIQIPISRGVRTTTVCVCVCNLEIQILLNLFPVSKLWDYRVTIRDSDFISHNLSRI